MKARRHPWNALLCLACIGWLAACDRARPDPVEPPVEVGPILLETAVNVQLGATPVGQRPEYIVTGQVRAERDGRSFPATIDSVRVHHRYGDGPWVSIGRYTGLPLSGKLPRAVVAGEQYEVRALVFGSAGNGSARVTGSDEWIAAGAAYQP